MFSSPFVPLTNSSLSLFTFFRSPHHTSLQPSSKLRITPRASTQGLPPLLNPRCFSQARGPRVLWNMHGMLFSLNQCSKRFRLFRYISLVSIADTQCSANKMDSTVPWILAVVSFPIMAGKQIINVVQLIKASRWLAEDDLQKRREEARNRRR